jgi:hypothetical protein
MKVYLLFLNAPHFISKRQYYCKWNTFFLTFFFSVRSLCLKNVFDTIFQQVFSFLSFFFCKNWQGFTLKHMLHFETWFFPSFYSKYFKQ